MKSDFTFNYLLRSRVMRILLVTSMLMFFAGDSWATHFRYGNITWRKVNNTTNEVEFTITTAWRGTFYGTTVPALGTNVSLGYNFNYGPGQGTAAMVGKVTARNVTEDWFVTETKLTKVYPNTTANYLAFFTVCCRISTLLGGAADQQARVETMVNIGNTNNSPTSTMPPIINLQVGYTAAPFKITAADPDNDTLRFRLATLAETGINPPTIGSVLIKVDSFGNATFNTAGRSVGQKFAASVAVMDGQSKIFVDFIVNIVAQSSPPIFDYSVTPSNGFTYQVPPGTPIKFFVKAYDTDSASSVSLSAVGIPSGSSWNPGSAANPKTDSFSWTPTNGDLGTRVLTFTAQDNMSVQTQTSVVIKVSLKPVFNVPPTPNAHIAVEPGDTVSFTVEASDPDNSDSVVINKLEGIDNDNNRVTMSNSLYSGVNFSLPTAKANPTSGSFSWIPGNASWGLRSIYFTAEDKYADKTEYGVDVIVNTTPSIGSTPPSSNVIAGNTFTYNFVSYDPDTAYGDILEIHHGGLPSWLTLTDNGDGTATLSGTPSIADSGTVSIQLLAEDIFHHSNVGGIPSQTFDITVIPCQVTAICKNITVGLDQNGSATISGSDVNDNSLANCGIQTLSLSKSAFDCSNIGANNVVLTVTDNYNVTGTCVAVVTVKDNTPPALVGVPSDTTVSCHVVPSAPQVTSTDNCSSSVSYNELVTPVNAPQNGLNGYWAFNENAGSTSEDLSTNNSTATLTSGASWTTGQSGSGVALAGNGSSYVNIPNTTNGPLDARYSVSMFASYKPSSLNNQMPIIQFNPGGWGCHLWDVGNGILFVRITHRNSLAFTTAIGANVLKANEWQCVGATYDYNSGYVKLWHNGNMVSQLYIGSLEISTNYPVRIGSVDFDGRRKQAAVDEVRIYNRALTAAEIATLCPSCPQNYYIQRTWTATDPSSNSVTKTQVIQVVDTTAPVISAPSSLTFNTDNGLCSATISYNASATDNCGNVSLSYSIPSGTSLGLGTHMVTITAKDECKNTSTHDITIVVQDAEAPKAICKNFGVAIDNNGNATISAADVNDGSNDACGIKSLSIDKSTFGCYNVGNNFVTLTVTDNNNNVSTCQSRVTVVDVTGPTAICKNITVQLDNNGTATISAADLDNGSNDPCGIQSMRIDKSTFDCTNVGANTVTFFVSDNHMNWTWCRATVTVEDNVAPVAICKNITVQLDNNGAASITAGDIDNGSNDACGIKSLSIDKSTFDCSNVGANTVTLTVTDNNNNVSTCQATVTVEDKVAPNAVAQNVTVTLSGGAASVTAAQVDNGSSDACGIQSMSVSPSSFDCSNIGANTVTLTVTDNNNNVSTTTATVTVVGTIPTVSVSQGVQPEFCQGGAVVMTATSNENVSYTWSNSSTTAQSNAYASGTYSVTVTNQYGCTATASTTVAYSQTDVLSAYTILAEDEVKLHQETKVNSGGVGSIGTSPKKSEIEVKDDSYITASGTFAKATKVEIKNGSSITNVYSGSPASVSLPAFVSNPNCKSSKNDVKVKKNTTVTIGDSIFKKIHIESGATVIFTSASIYAEEIETQKDATIKFTRCSKVYLCGELKIHENNTFNAESLSVLIYAEKKVDIKKGTELTASIYTRGHLDTKGDKKERNTLTGMFIAEQVHAHYTEFNSSNVCGNCGTNNKREYSENKGGLRTEDYINVYPNPTSSATTVAINANAEGKLKVSLMNLNGQLVRDTQQDDFSGMAEVSVDMTDCAEGMYFIKVEYGDKVQVFKVHKVH